jgi:CHAT domain-containing protein
LFGLQRALLQAGARTVVSSQWDVYDQTGPEVMGGFFQRLAARTPSAQALADSQREFLARLRSSGESEPWLHPYFWASYTVSGDDRTTCK